MADFKLNSFFSFLSKAKEIKKLIKGNENAIDELDNVMNVVEGKVTEIIDSISSKKEMTRKLNHATKDGIKLICKNKGFGNYSSLKKDKLVEYTVNSIFDSRSGSESESESRDSGSQQNTKSNLKISFGFNDFTINEFKDYKDIEIQIKRYFGVSNFKLFNLDIPTQEPINTTYNSAENYFSNIKEGNFVILISAPIMDKDVIYIVKDKRQGRRDDRSALWSLNIPAMEEKFGPISGWNVSQITTMSNWFYDMEDFNQPLNNWDVSNVQDMKGMFYGCTNFNQPLIDWNVGNCKSFQYMFCHCSNFNQPLTGWNVRNGRIFNYMFSGCINFNSNLDDWKFGDTVFTTFSNMFSHCHKLNQDFLNWNIPSIGKDKEARVDVSDLDGGTVELHTRAGYYLPWERDESGKFKLTDKKRIYFMYYGCFNLERLPDWLPNRRDVAGIVAWYGR